jgi:hypothetical protein
MLHILKSVKSRKILPPLGTHFDSCKYANEFWLEYIENQLDWMLFVQGLVQLVIMYL